MGDFLSWNVSLGTYAGIRVRLHALFLLFGILTLYFCTQISATLPLADPAQGSSLVPLGLTSLAVLLVSVLIHEMGHAYAAVWLGGQVQQIVLAPWGGLLDPVVPREPRAEYLTAFAGPLFNLIVVLIAGTLLALSEGFPSDLIFSPRAAESLLTGSFAARSLKLVLWINWLLVLVNLIPAFPFDGGKMMRPFLWRFVGYSTAVWAVAWFAKIVAVGLVFKAFLGGGFEAAGPMPFGVPLLLLATLLYFSAAQEAQRLDSEDLPPEIASDEFSSSYLAVDRATDSAPPRPNRLRRWLESRRAERLKQQRLRELADERALDDVLAHLHGEGRDKLTSEEIALLNRMSSRFRSRPKDV